MKYKMQDALHLCVKALDAVCCCICVAAGPLPVLCCSVSAEHNYASLCPLNTRTAPLVSRELDHVLEDIFMTCLPHSVPLPTLLLPLLFTDSSLIVDTGHWTCWNFTPIDHVRS